MDRFSKQFGARLKKSRSERGLTQAELASLASVGANYVPRLERGEMTPSVDAAFRLAQVLGVSVDSLCASSTKPEPLQDAARPVLALTEADVGAFRRTVKAVEALRATMRGEKVAAEEETEEPSDSSREAKTAKKPAAAAPKGKAKPAAKKGR
jgi:transcriptional regulator with XRE-family HTH domain